MKRCPTCNRVETDDALKFCRVDGATLVDSLWLGNESGTAQLGSSPNASEVHTSILSNKTDAVMGRATGPTTALPFQMPPEAETPSLLLWLYLRCSLPSPLRLLFPIAQELAGRRLIQLRCCHLTTRIMMPRLSISQMAWLNR